MMKSQWNRHCENETVEPVSGDVKGEIPLWLEGNLIRNGPGVIKFGDTSYNHLFDGQALLHKFTISGGKATYQSRILQSDSYKKNKEKERIVVTEFGTIAYPDPCMSLFEKFRARLSFTNTDNCNVNVAFYGDQLYALTETNFARRIDPDTLETIGDKTTIRVVNTSTAHPHILPDGTMLNLGSHFRNKKGPHVCIYKVPENYDKEESSFDNLKLLAEIPSRWKMNPGYYHSFGMSQKNIVFIESPLCVNVPKALTMKLMKRSFLEVLVWHGKEKTRFHVVSIEDGKINPIIYEGPALFTFHHINSYEVDGHLIVDIVAYDDDSIFHSTVLDKIEIFATPRRLDDKILHSTALDKIKIGATPRRFVLPIKIAADAKLGDNLVKLPNSKATAKIRSMGRQTIVDLTPQYLNEEFLELPRINYKLNGQKYNFIYGIGDLKYNGSANSPLEHNVIVKIDIEKGIRTEYFAGKDRTISEPIFVSNPNSSDEDDGILLATVLFNDKPNDVQLTVLNAKNMKELASVKFRAADCVPATFHGQFHANEARVKIN